VTTPFQFDRRIDLARLQVGVDPDAPASLVARLREIGLRPRPIGPRPTVSGAGGGLGIESAAAFDDYVRGKSAAVGLDLAALPPTPTAPPLASAGNPMAPADWNPRFVNGRVLRAFDYIQSQRRRQALLATWSAFMKDLDLFIAGPTADVAANAQTGHPCVVLPYAFDVPPSPPSGARVGNDAPAPPAVRQPVCATIVGALYADDVILSVASRFQDVTDFHTRRPTL
jgi:hypothetical protein